MAGIVSPLSRGFVRPLPEAIEIVHHRFSRRPLKVLDLGVNVIWLQSVPKISIERFAELLEDYSFAELLEDCLQVIGVFPSGLSSLVGARRPVCPFVLGWRLLLFHGAILPKSYPARMGHSGG